MNGLRIVTNNPGEGFWKWIRVLGQYRFVDGALGTHTGMLKKGETAETAGSVMIFSDYYRIHEQYSSTLKVSMDDQDITGLQRLIGKAELVSNG